MVVAIGSIAFARRGTRPDLKLTGSVSGTPTPTAERPAARSGSLAPTAFAASGPWTMSALPECFRERERIRGSLAALRPQFPPAAQRIRPSSVVVAGVCTITVGAHELVISRGADRLRVPPEARLFRALGGLTLVYTHGATAEIRRY